MDLKLRITQKEGSNMSSLIKQMCALKCRINVDTEAGDIFIDGMDDNSVENVIDSINEAFNIVGVDIVPTAEILKPEEPVVTAESLEIEKIEFSNKEVEEQVNKLMRIIYWTMYSNKAPSHDICKYLKTAGTEIKMKYDPYELPEIFVGDIVVCNYGNHPNGEISGGYVHAIVCDIDEDGMIYAVPITKEKFDEVSNKYLPFENKGDVIYNEPGFTGGTVLLKRGRYICPQRIWKSVGTTRPEFFSKVLETLPHTVRFSHNDYAEELAEKYGDVDNDDSMLFDDTDIIQGEVTSKVISDEGETETPAVETSGDDANEILTEETTEEGVEESPSSESSREDMNTKKGSDENKKTSAEDYITSLLSSSLEMLDISKPVEEIVDMFLKGIGFETKGEIIKQSFLTAFKIKKINYENLLPKLREVFPAIREEIIKASLREEFNIWLERYPDIKEKYPKISFMVLLKVFVKKCLS